VQHLFPISSGLNNDFLIKQQDELSLRYNDHAPLENHHIAAAWALLKEDKYNFLKDMPLKV
jgi:cAMP-specific phosphodiesterase 4/high affinity cAMP-specific and IBMX-insensitive 3',5'-cyclic phosphodiesterase 8